jgi:hypothetical protein
MLGLQSISIGIECNFVPDGRHDRCATKRRSGAGALNKASCDSGAVYSSRITSWAIARCLVAKLFDYVLAVWLRLEVSGSSHELLAEIKENLEQDYQIIEFSGIENPECKEDGQLTVSLRLQVTFNEWQMQGDEPSQEALGKLDAELTAYLETSYQVSYLQILDDALTSHLLAEREEPEQRGFPEAHHCDPAEDEPQS